MNSNRIFPLIIFFAIINVPVRSQSSEFMVANSTYESSTKKLYDYYSIKIAEASRIHNSPEYYHNDIIIGGNPFWGTTQFHDGSVIFEGIRFDNQEIGYDIFRDELFISRYDQQGILSKVKLPDYKVDAFILTNQKFIRLQEPSDFKNHPGTGYYEILYNGNLKVLAKRKKKILPSSDGLYKYRFEISDKLFVVKDNTFHIIILKRTLKKLFDDEKKQVRNYIRHNRKELNDIESYVVKVCRYYDTLKEEGKK